MNREGTGKFNTDSSGHTYRYDKGGGSDIDTSDKTQRESDIGHIGEKIERRLAQMHPAI